MEYLVIRNELEAEIGCQEVENLNLEIVLPSSGFGVSQGGCMLKQTVPPTLSVDNFCTTKQSLQVFEGVGASRSFRHSVLMNWGKGTHATDART